MSAVFSQIHSLRSAYSQALGFPSQHLPACTHRIGLFDLPNELLDNIASRLSREDLFTLRELKNRTIRNGIDHVWVCTT